MMRVELGSFLANKGLLLAVAAPLEAKAVLEGLSCQDSARMWEPLLIRPQIELLLTGIGKVNAAAAVARVLTPLRHGAVISVGIAGALPTLGTTSGVQFLPIGTSIAASACVFADEGVRTPDGFTDCAALGFPLGDFPGSVVPTSAELLMCLRPCANTVGPIATVSTCSGMSSLAKEVAARTGAVAEAMEGAAVAQVAHRIGVPAGELRVISNTTGDRSSQVWDIRAALAALTAVIGRMS